MLENNIKRRLYRVLTLQTPDMGAPKADNYDDDYVTPVPVDGTSSPRKYSSATSSPRKSSPRKSSPNKFNTEDLAMSELELE